MLDLLHACTQACTDDRAAHPVRGAPLLPRIGDDGAPLALSLRANGPRFGVITSAISRPVTIIGRGRAADLSLSSDMVSRRACVLRVCVHGVTLEELGAGTLVTVNGQRFVRGRLFALDRILIGDVEVQLLEHEPSQVPGA